MSLRVDALRRRARRIGRQLAERRAAGRAVRQNRARGTHCFYCGVAFDPSGPCRRTVDHRVPRGRGGTDGSANLVFACEACNRRKADDPEASFVGSDWLRERRAALERGDRDRPVT